MYDKTLTQLTTIDSVDGTELLYVVDNISTTPSSKSISIDSLFGNATNVVSTSLKTTKLSIDASYTPSSSAETNTDPVGTIYYDADYGYIKVAEGSIKRFALVTF